MVESNKDAKAKSINLVDPGSFENEKHFYSKVLNAQVHPLIYYFFNLTKEKLIERYCHLNPSVKREKLDEILSYSPQHMYWAGADLFYATTKDGRREIVLIETNSSPSGQKSMPLLEEKEELGGYERLIRNSFLPLVKKLKDRLPKGHFAVIYDKNAVEASGYAATIADITNTKCFLVPFFSKESEDIFFEEGIMYIKYKKKKVAIKAAFRYVTQKPWDRIPVNTKTLIYNPIIVCLAGGRNKLIASKAYELLNSEYSKFGLKINLPYTVNDVQKQEIPLWLKRFQGHAVVKVPYLNAGQGVFTITSKEELKKFMQTDFSYNQFIIQSLIGNSTWSSKSPAGTFFHIGTMPNQKGNIFVADLRLMVMATPTGIVPVAIYARRAAKALKKSISQDDSWEILGTNLSVKQEDGSWTSDTNRLMLMDRKDFNKLGLGIDELIEAFVQTVMALIAIDKMSSTLLDNDGKLRKKLFKSLNTDFKFIQEILEEKTP
jgi:hypothetical protein